MSSDDERLDRHRRLAQVAAAHDAWVRAHERVVHDPADASPGVKGTDYGVHHVDRSATLEQERELADLVAGGFKAYNPNQARHQPGAPLGLGGQWATMPGGGSSRPRQRLPQIAGLDVELAGRDPAIRALITANAKGTPPDPAKTRVLAARDARGRPSAYVVWQSEDGGAVPKGTVHEVWVHRAHRGKGVGDALVQQAVALDPDVQPTANPNVARAAAAPAPAVPTLFPAPAPAAPSRPARAPRAAPSGAPAGGAAPATGGYSGDFDADAKRIDQLQRRYMGAGQDTVSLHSRGGRYSRAREREQQAIIDHFLTQPNVRSDRKLLVLGGLPGAGKTTYLNSPAGQAELGIDLSEYVTVNADEVKEQMVARGMVPSYPGLTPDEAATLYHQESFEIAHSLMQQAARQGKNFVYDTSLKSSGQLGFATGAARSTGKKWDTQLVFIDVPIQTAKDRAQARYEGGGRYMPLALIDGMRAYGGRANSGPAQEFQSVKGQVDSWTHVDNTGTPSVVGRGGKRPARSAPAAAAPPSRVAPAPATSNRTAPSVGGSPTPVAAPLATSTVAPAAPRAAVPANLPPVPPGAVVYAHPKGKHVYVLPDGSMQTWKPDGTAGTSSATPAKLAAGYGGWTQVSSSSPKPATTTSASAPTLVTSTVDPDELPSTPAPQGAMPVAPMDFDEAPLSDVPAAIADPDVVFQQKVDGIRGVLVVEPGKQPWFASKKGQKLQSSVAAKITGPMLAAMPPAPAGTPAYRVEGELLDGKFHVFDMVVVGEESTPYETRKQMADAWVAAVAPAMPQASALPTATTSAAKQALWDAVVNSGAEGVMMKRRDAPYSAGARASHSRKAKVTATADVVVTQVGVGGKDNAEIALMVGGQVTPIGTVSAAGKGSLTVGEVVEVEYLWATPNNTLAQPRIKRRRPDKGPADATDSAQLRQVDKTVLDMAVKQAAVRLERALLQGAVERKGEA